MDFYELKLKLHLKLQTISSLCENYTASMSEKHAIHCNLANNLRKAFELGENIEINATLSL